MTKIKKKPQPDLTEYWETLTAKYLTLRSNVLPKIGKEFENEELSKLISDAIKREINKYSKDG